MDILSFAAAAFDQQLNTASETNSLEEISEADYMPHICAKEINADPWKPTSVAALSAVLRGETFSWCMTHRLRLKQRIRNGATPADALKVWDRDFCKITAGMDDESPRTIMIKHERLGAVRWNRTVTTPRVD